MSQWKDQLPEKEGLYVYKRHLVTEKLLITVAKGDWRKAQDPDEMYANAELLFHLLGARLWFGPIPELVSMGDY